MNHYTDASNIATIIPGKQFIYFRAESWIALSVWGKTCSLATGLTYVRPEF